MTDLQTWTILKERGRVWFDDEQADATIFLQLVSDAPEKNEDSIPVDEPTDPNTPRFHLVSSQKRYVVKGCGFKRSLPVDRLLALIRKQFDGICEVVPG